MLFTYQNLRDVKSASEYECSVHFFELQSHQFRSFRTSANVLWARNCRHALGELAGSRRTQQRAGEDVMAAILKV